MNRSELSFKKIFSAVAVLVVLILCTFVYWYFSTQKLTVVCNNCSAIVFKESDFEEQKYDNGKKLTNNQTVRLKKGSYVVGYKGDSGFADGNTVVVLGDKAETAEINPVFSPDKLAEILKGEKQKIDAVLTKSFAPTISQYTISEGQLLDYGDWYATTLIYNGDDAFNADSLRIIMKKDGSGIWSIASGRPEIIISKNLNKNIPKEIIDSANQLQGPLADRFLSEQDRRGVNQ